MITQTTSGVTFQGRTCTVLTEYASHQLSSRPSNEAIAKYADAEPAIDVPTIWILVTSDIQVELIVVKCDSTESGFTFTGYIPNGSKLVSVRGTFTGKAGGSFRIIP